MLKIVNIIIFSLVLGCNYSNKVNPLFSAVDSSKVIKSNLIKSRQKVITKIPSLKDSDFVKGNCVVFLLPDSLRFESYPEEQGKYEVDSDFGFAISTALDTVEKDKKLRFIKTYFSEKRYIVIKDYRSGLKVIDRDSIDYGIILVSKLKDVYVYKGSIYDGTFYIEMIRNFYRK